MKTELNTPPEVQKVVQENESSRLTIEDLYDKYSSVLFGVATRIMGNEELAEGVLTESFIEINSQIDQIQFDPNISKCLIAIVRRRSYQKLNTQNKNHHPSNFVYTSDAMTISEKTNSTSIPKETIIDLIIYGGLTINEAAEVLKISIQDAMQLLRKEVNHYRKKLNQ